MIKKIVFIFFAFLFAGNIAWSQDIDSSVLTRFNNNGETNFRAYLAANLIFPESSRNKIGVLLSGMVLEANGNIQQVFCLNSLDPEIDNHVLDLIESSAEYWKPSTSGSKAIIFIVPIVFTNGKMEVKIDKGNFKFPVLDEIYVTAYGSKSPSGINKISKLLAKYDGYISEKNYEQANQIIAELMQREPFNIDFYNKYIQVNKMMGNEDIVTQTKEFLNANFIE